MPTPGKRGRPGAGRTLTEDEILDATLDLLDEGGAAAASVRGIAGRVGVAPNAVYTYFPDKTAVLSALVERLLGEVDQDALADRGIGRGGSGWKASRWTLRARLMAHPGAVEPDDRRTDGRPERAGHRGTAARAAGRRRARRRPRPPARPTC